MAVGPSPLGRRVMDAWRTSALLRRFTTPGQSKRRVIPLRLGRNALPQILKLAGARCGAEVGVWKGAYSLRWCQQQYDWLAVDPWEPHVDWLDTKNSLPPAEAAVLIHDAYTLACAALAPYPRCRIVRKYSVAAAAAVNDRSLDVVYIDGNHTFAAVTADLTAWLPKVRRGGVLAGHDYRVFPNKPMIHVIDALTAFTEARGLGPVLTLTKDPTPSWCLVVH